MREYVAFNNIIFLKCTSLLMNPINLIPLEIEVYQIGCLTSLCTYWQHFKTVQHSFWQDIFDKSVSKQMLFVNNKTSKIHLDTGYHRYVVVNIYLLCNISYFKLVKNTLDILNWLFGDKWLIFKTMPDARPVWKQV